MVNASLDQSTQGTLTCLHQTLHFVVCIWK